MSNRLCLVATHWPRMFANLLPKRSTFLRELLRGSLVAVALLTLSGCNRFGGEQVAPDLLEILPQNWTPIDEDQPWEIINIDGDAKDEYLLLYAYGIKNLNDPDDDITQKATVAAGAPVGATIYDDQNSSEFVVDEPALPTPLQPAATFIPYRIGPSYFPSPNAAYVGQYSSPDSIGVTQYATDQAGLCPATGEDASVNEVAIVDPGKTFTTAWWRTPYLGYGVAQVNAPGGFRRPIVLTGSGVEEVALNAITGPIWSIDALYPIYAPENPLDTSVRGGYADPLRSMLCRMLRYYRTPVATTEGGSFRGDVAYVDHDLGIQFCRGNTEIDPFFPEGVVLEFLLNRDARMALLSDRIPPDDVTFLLDSVAFFDQTRRVYADYCDSVFDGDQPARALYRVDDLETRAMLAYSDSYRLTRSADQIDPNRLFSFVCAEIAPVDSVDDPAVGPTRLLFFSLEHEPPTQVDIDEQTVYYTDRLFIVGVEDATTWGAPNCKVLIAQNTAEPVDISPVDVLLNEDALIPVAPIEITPNEATPIGAGE